MTGYIALTPLDLAWGACLVLINALLSLILDLGIHRRLLIAASRMVVQLSLMGLVLSALFSHVSPWWTALAAILMILFAGREATARQDRPLGGWWSYGVGTVAISMAATVVTVFALTTALGPDPWYDPRYAIPLLGMVLGNTMNGVSLGLHTLTNGVVLRRGAVEARLMLGATRMEALGPVIRDSLRSALMPVINGMAATGLVTLPGMMTGQILGGVAPMDAVKYQILVMFLLSGGAGIGAVTAVLGGVRRLTDNRHRLRLDHLARGGSLF